MSDDNAFGAIIMFFMLPVIVFLMGATLVHTVSALRFICVWMWDVIRGKE